MPMIMKIISRSAGIFPENISGKIFYEPGKNQREEELRRFLKERWKNKYGY